MFEFIDVLFALLAGVIFTIIMLVIGVSLEHWLINLIIIMVLMLSVGFVYKAYIKKHIFKTEEKDIEEAEEETDEESESEGRVVSTSFDDEDDEYDEY